jgi:membrane protease YdiL (CAAX protease family)
VADVTSPPFITGARWSPFLLGLALAYAVFDTVAERLGSDRGQAGLAVGGLVVATTLLFERWRLGVPFASSVRRFGRPTLRGLVAALGVAALLGLVVPVYALATGSAVTMYPGWMALIPGLFVQAGVAEETLFRGYLFGHLRRGRTFWRAVVLAAGPFVLVHLVLFARLPWAVATASVLLAAIVPVPLAFAYELGGRTIWAPAVLHFAFQGIVKVVRVEGSAVTFALVWIAASAVLPFAVFSFGRNPMEPCPR